MSRGLGDVYKRQQQHTSENEELHRERGRGREGVEGGKLNLTVRNPPNLPSEYTTKLRFCRLAHSRQSPTVLQTMNSGKGEEGEGVVHRGGVGKGGDSQSLARSFRWQYGAAIPADRFPCMLCSVTEQKQGSGDTVTEKANFKRIYRIRYICPQLSLSYSTCRLHTVSRQNNHSVCV